MKKILLIFFLLIPILGISQRKYRQIDNYNLSETFKNAIWLKGDFGSVSSKNIGRIQLKLNANDNYTLKFQGDNVSLKYKGMEFNCDNNSIITIKLQFKKDVVINMFITTSKRGIYNYALFFVK